MNLKRASRPVLAASAAALLAACGFFAKPQVTQYYLLDYLPTPPKERIEKGPYPYVVRVRDCNIAEAYRRSQIVYRQSANQMQFYGLHLWAVDPDRMVNDLLVKHLKAARLFENVTRTVENYVPDYFLSCDIQAIEEYDSKEQWYAHMSIEYQLENAKTNQIVWKKLYDLRKTVPQQEPVFIVRELSFLVENINERMVQEMEVVLDEARYKTLTRKDSVSADSLSNRTKP
ncbi:MAG TPA: ABC-type transport auxiliary lipoprotein family protein [Fibrobacteria bacterium]|nr:ABC-type transport auxiliary lipoprotein family protein [Fibrobacteria bacterium]